MTAKTLMIQGTGSNVGKSFIVAGLCRFFRDRGLAVAPFKSQNMALNSFAAGDGLEIGRAQATQALACGVAPTVHMNPILLKPTSDRRAQVVLRGQAVDTWDATAYRTKKTEMLAVIEDSLNKLVKEYDLVIIEGAGSPAEINLMENDIANMAIAEMADAPVFLVVDIDKGGAFAAIIGTLELLKPVHRARVKGLIINKFRGDPTLLQSGLDFIEQRTGVPVLGVIPHTDIKLEAEDSVCLDGKTGRSAGAIRIAVPLLPRISNFTDLGPIERIGGMFVDYISSLEEFGRPDCVIILGSKNSLLDIEWLKATGLGEAIVESAAAGTPVIGICGGFQMLGIKISDPLGIEGRIGSEATGLGLLPITTVLQKNKVVRQTNAKLVNGADILGKSAVGAEIAAYEIHAGSSETTGAGVPLAITNDGAADGLVSPYLPVAGTYLHGLFDNKIVRVSFIDRLAGKKGFSIIDNAPAFEERIDRLANLLGENLRIDRIFKIIGIEAKQMESLGAGAK